MNNILSNINIIEYNGKYNKEINDFVNLSMHILLECHLNKKKN